MEIKKIAAAVLVSSLGFSAIPSFAAKMATLNVFMRIPPENPCDVTLNGNQTRAVNLGTINRSQPDIEMSKTVNVKIACNANRAVRIKLYDDRIDSVLVGDISESGIQLPEDADLLEHFILTEGVRNFGGFYSLRSSEWKAQVEAAAVDGQPAQLGVEEDVNIIRAGDDAEIKASPLQRDTEYYFKSAAEDAANQMAAKVFTGKLEVFSEGKRISKKSRGILQGITQIEAFYL